MKTVTALVLVLMIGMAGWVQPSEAQSGDNSLTLTEAFINTAIQANQTASNGTFIVDLQSGQVVLRLSGTGQQGNAFTITLTLVPSVQNGQANWTATALTLNDVAVDLARLDQSGGRAASDTFEGFVRQQNVGVDGTLQAITVTDSAITFSYQPADATAPTVAIVDNSVSLTFTESSVNSLAGIVNPVNPNLSGMSVDFQAGRVVLNATRTSSAGTPQTVQVTFVPFINNGIATWTVSAMLVDGQAAGDTDITQMNDSIVASWRAYFTGLYQTGSLTDITLTDSTATFTWDADLAGDNQPAGVAQSNVVITEADINTFYHVTNPGNYHVSDVAVDLQPGQVIIAANWTLANGTVVPEVVTLVPTLENGRVSWTVTQATLGDTAFDADAIARMNEAIVDWWSGVYWGRSRDYQITTFQVTDTEIRYAAVPR